MPDFTYCYKYVVIEAMGYKTYTGKMVKHVCFNGTMANTDNYSSPIPLVGLYIAAASMVCALLVLCDVWAGFKRKMWWFPCRFFSINSVTLTLISIAAKIPVDLTTNMPSNQDQLSKLCGSVFICVCMIFIRPSIVSNAEFESYANVTALSIFVITVVVNICIQMATGVIFSFMAEHVIILIWMLILLLGVWFSVITINPLKTNRADGGPDLKNGEGNMLARLKLCYIYNYQSCLQFLACTNPVYGDAPVICMICLIVLVQATLRSVALKEFKFCEGVSDYGWSIWWVVATQIFTVAVVTCAMGGRWIAACLRYFQDSDPHPMAELGDTDNIYLHVQYLISLRNLPKFVEKIFKFGFFLPLYIFHFAVVILFGMVWFVLVVVLPLAMVVGCCKWKWSHLENTPDAKSEAYEKELTARHVPAVKKWLLKKGVADMERWMASNGRKSVKHLVCLFSNVPPSGESSSYYVGLNGEGIRLSLLSMILLVEMAKEVTTTTIQEDKPSLTSILAEVFDILYFIENNVNMGSSYDRLRSMSARAIFKWGLTNGVGVVVQQNLDFDNSKVNFKVMPKLSCENRILFDYPNMCIEKETSAVSDLINYRRGESSEVVYGRIEQLFVDMLHAFLAQLPVVVFAYILESPFEEYGERVRLCLGYVCKLQPIESRIGFSLPPGTNITSLFHAQTSVSCPQQVQDVSAPSLNIAHAIVDVGEIQEEWQVTGQQV